MERHLVFNAPPASPPPTPLAQKSLIATHQQAIGNWEPLGRRTATQQRPWSSGNSSVLQGTSSPSSTRTASSVGHSSARNRSTQTLEDEQGLQVEELLDDDIGYDSDIEIYYPDELEEMDSDMDERDEPVMQERYDLDATIVRQFRGMHCEDNDSSEQERTEQKRERIRKRWGPGLLKRTHSQSVGSDTDVEDAEALDAHDVELSARRLRRRVRGPGDGSPLMFEDLPSDMSLDSSAQTGGSTEEQSRPLDAAPRGMNTLPFWVLEDPMEIDSTASNASSAV
ncbi:hypothetical protein LTR50_000815 [Elasticomyces elasticus]|nr:hypothetical protein LTR50_000815 [Elasticomyces elasticus]